MRPSNEGKLSAAQVKIDCCRNIEKEKIDRPR